MVYPRPCPAPHITTLVAGVFVGGWGGWGCPTHLTGETPYRCCQNCQGHSGAQSWPEASTHLFWLQVGLWTWPRFLCLPFSTIRPAGLLPSFTRTKETSDLILQPSGSLLHTVRESNKQPHGFHGSHELSAWLCQLATSQHRFHDRLSAL